MIQRILRRLTIRNRIISLLVVLLILCAALFIMAIVNQASLVNQLQQSANVDRQLERDLQLVSVRVMSARVNMMRYLTGIVVHPRDALGDVNQAKDLLEGAQTHSTVPEQIAAIETVLLEIEEYKWLIGRLQTARSQGSDEAFESTQSDLHQKELDLEQRIESITAENAQRLELSSASAVEKAQRHLVYFAAGLGTLFILALAGGFLVARSVTHPVYDLQEGVESLRSGHLDTLIPITGQDELSWLARTFNQMTAQIAKSYTELEGRVAERTRAVEARALQLQVASEVARDAASVSELDNLLYRAVSLIHERFNLYFVSIYLIDDLGKYAVLRAATGEAGRSLIQREHKLRIGEVGIVGYVTGMGAPRIVNDVDADFVYRREAMLPETRSEMALPLKTGTSVIGALDVQSSQLNAFGEDDLSAMQILADQLAVAIKNTRLVGELEDRLSEINTLYRRYIQESVSLVTHGRQQIGYQYDLLSVQAGLRKLNPKVMEQLQQGQKVVVQEEVQGAVKSRLLVPLTLYDQMIGVLGFDEDNPDYQWSADEIVIIDAVANQVVQALDNARLLDETQLRTDQLRLLQEITATAVAHTSLPELVKDVSRKLRAGLDVERCVIALMEPDGATANRVAIDSAHPMPAAAAVPGVQVRIGEDDPIRQVLKNRKSTALYVEKDMPLPTSGLDLPSQPVIRSVVLIPLLAREAGIGLIKLDVIDPNRRFSEEDLQFFDQLSLQISTAVEVARGIEQTRNRAERERVISEVTARLRATLDVETVLQTAVDEIYQTGDFSDVSIYLTEANE